VTGLLAAAVALGVSQLAAGITGPVGSPVVSVGQSVIGLTPRPVTDFVIKIFGPHDKPVLLITIVVLLALFAAAFGIATMRRPAAGFAGLAIFAVIGLVAVATRPNSAPVDVVPTLAGAGVGAWALARLARAAGAGDARAGAARAGAAGAGAAGAGDTGAADTGAADPRAGDAPSYGSRRSFIAASTVAAAGAAASGLVGNLLSQRSTVTQSRALVKLPPPVTRLPPLAGSTDLHIPGLSPFVTPNGSFYRVDTALFIPQVAPGSWRLRVHGMVTRELDITFAELLRRPLTEADITLCCVSNPVGGPYIGNARWLGVSLASVLREAGIKRGADQLLSTSTDGYTSGTPVATVMDGRNALLAVAMNGAPLPVAHGFPARMIVPGLYGYVSATKWVTDINVTTFAAEQGYWVQQGWTQRGPIKTQSRIDVPNGTSPLKAGHIVVAGVAWAQHRGVAAVEVRVDGGAWQEARLATVPGIDTWRQWVWDWDAAAGSHLLEVRATDATGYTQTGAQANIFPDGATGWHSVQVTVSA
jgi:DMSO/TMAO reductase YedYZ molybdopterin-dependent catalytic subunit